jgi:hypothetical protein
VLENYIINITGFNIQLIGSFCTWIKPVIYESQSPIKTFLYPFYHILLNIYHRPCSDDQILETVKITGYPNCCMFGNPVFQKQTLLVFFFFWKQIIFYPTFSNFISQS